SAPATNPVTVSGKMTPPRDKRTFGDFMAFGLKPRSWLGIVRMRFSQACRLTAPAVPTNRESKQTSNNTPGIVFLTTRSFVVVRRYPLLISEPPATTKPVVNAVDLRMFAL